MIEDELNYPDTMKKKIGKQEYNSWVDKSGLGKAYDTYTQRFQPQHIYCYPVTSEPPAPFICIGRYQFYYFYIKRSTR